MSYVTSSSSLALSSSVNSLALNYATQVKSNPNNPANDVIFNPNYEVLYDRNSKAIRPIGLRLKPIIESAGLNLENVRPKQVPDVPPWTLKQPTVLLNLSNCKKSSTSSVEFQSKFLELKSEYSDHFEIYTDGSKDDTKAGCASVSSLHTSKMRLPDNSSIFSAEVMALELALRFIETHRDRKFIILF